MNKAILKLIKFIKDGNTETNKRVYLIDSLGIKSREYNQIKKEFLETVKERLYFIEYLERSVEDEYEVFVNFEELSYLFQEMPLKIKEKFEIIIYIIKKNLDIGILSPNNFYFNKEVFMKHRYKSAPLEEIMAFINTYPFDKSEEELHLSTKEKAIYDELKEVSSASFKYIDSITFGHFLINKYFLSKIPNITAKDVKLTVQGFKKCGLSESVVNELAIYLSSIISKGKTEPMVVNKTSINVKPMLSNKELKMLNRELSYYYDFDHNKVIRAISLDEEMHIINIMQRLGFKREVMVDILNKFKNISNIDPFVLYVRLYDKYKNTRGSEEVLLELEGYFQNMFICDEEEYVINKMCFIDTFNKLLSLTDDDYEYEFNYAKSLKR